MTDYPPHRIGGPRLLLPLPVLDDAGELFQRVARDPQVTKYLLWTPHPDVAATRRVITEKMNVRGHDRTWAIVLQHSDEIIGMISCRRPVRHSAEIGYCIGRRWWGKGLMSEALDMLLAALRGGSRCLSRLGHLQCRQRAVSPIAGAGRFPVGDPAERLRGLTQSRARTTRQSDVHQIAALDHRERRHLRTDLQRAGKFATAVVIEDNVPGDDVDIPLGTLQRVIQKLRACAGHFQQIGDD